MRNYDFPWAWSPHYYGLIEEDMRQTDCLMVCVAHQGRHPFLAELDACHELPKGLRKLERVRIANQDRKEPAWTESPEPALDPAALAAAIVMAARELRGQRNHLPETPAPISSTDLQAAPRRVIDLGDQG